MISNQRRAAWLGAAAVLGLAALSFSGRAARAQDTPPAAPAGQPGQAAPRRGGGNGGGARGGQQGRNMPNPVLAAFAATKPTADEQTKFDALNKQMRTDMRGLQTLDPTEQAAKRQAMNTKFREDVKALLTDDQKKIFDAEMAKAPMMGGANGGIMGQLASLNLTADEKAKIDPLVADTQKQIAALPQADRRTKAPELLTDLKAKIRPLLTTDQQTKLDAMTLRNGRGGGRGGAGGGGGRRAGGGAAGGAGGQGAPPPPPPAP